MKLYKFKKNISIGLFASGVMIPCFILSSCVNEDNLLDSTNSDEILFHGYVANQIGMETRANLNIFDVTSDYHGGYNFYIREKGKDDNNVDKVDFAKYIIRSGASGVLSPVDKTLNWYSRSQFHNFWIYTVPFNTDYEPELNPDGSIKSMKIEFKDTNMEDVVYQSTDTNPPKWTVYEDESRVNWKNGECLEKLFGGKTTRDYRFNVDGMYVPVTMKHLVSKIMVKDFRVIDNSAGTSTGGIKAVMTIYGLPNEATYYPSSFDSEGNELAPRVEMPKDWNYDQSKGVNFVVAASQAYLHWEGVEPNVSSSSYLFRDAWYVCPEIDLSKLSFKIELYQWDSTSKSWIINKSRGQHGAFFGDFSSIVLDRSKGNNYDDIENPESDKTILHAGEFLGLTLYLHEKGSPVIRGELYSWYSDYNRTANSHVEQGIYYLTEMTEFTSIMNGNDDVAKDECFTVKGSQKDTGSDPEGEYPDYEELFGHELKIFELYNDIGSDSYSSSTSSSKLSNVYCPDPYILDGRGHTLNVNSGTSLPIGNIRDVYLHYYYRSSSAPYTVNEYMVYIDKMGNVYTVDMETYEETPTGYNVNEKSKTKNPMTINLRTGVLS